MSKQALCFQIKKGEEEKFRKHFKNFYVNREGNLYFFRRIPTNRVGSYIDKINKIGKVKII